MSLSQRYQRFFASTRGQIITLLRRSSRTVDELAQALDLTDNAVRAHLATLERDGLVQQRGVRRGSGKPASVYDLTVEADQLFQKHTARCFSKSWKFSVSAWPSTRWKRFYVR